MLSTNDPLIRDAGPVDACGWHQTEVVAAGLITATLGAALIVAATASGVTPGGGQKATVTVAGAW
jgi:hypothetical protein